MPLSIRVALLSVLALSVAAPMAAEEIGSAPSHLRPESQDARALLHEAAARSATVRALVARLEQSDVVVYIRFTPFASAALEGRVGFLTAAGGLRYLVVELACRRPLLAQLEILGHELHHAAEIADATSVVSIRTLSQHYTRIGMRLNNGWNVETFETQGAIAAATRVHRDLFATPVRMMEER